MITNILETKDTIVSGLIRLTRLLYLCGFGLQVLEVVLWRVPSAGGLGTTGLTTGIRTRTRTLTPSGRGCFTRTWAGWS